MQSRRFRLNDQAEEGCMAKLIYSMLTSLDGYTEDEHGQFGWGAPEDASPRSECRVVARVGPTTRMAQA
jgi:hypothetical protein